MRPRFGVQGVELVNPGPEPESRKAEIVREMERLQRLQHLEEISSCNDVGVTKIGDP